MKKLLLFIFCVLTLQAFSQGDDIVYLKGSKVDDWFDKTMAEMKRKELSKSEVINAQAQSIPTNMMEILIQHDWVRIGKIFFKDGGYDKTSMKSPRNIDFERYTQNGIRYGLRCYKRASEQSYFVDYNSGKNPKISIIKANGKNFLKYDYANVNGEPISYGQLISYKNGVLIYDLTRDGTIYATNSLSRYRIVLMAVPRINIGNTLKGVNSPYLNPNENPNPNYGNTINTNQLSFPSYNYPNTNISSKHNCNNPISEEEFDELAQEADHKTDEYARLTFLNQVAHNFCINTAQAMRFASLLKNDNNRLNFLKETYKNCYDVDNFPSASQVFSSNSAKSQFMAFLAQKGIISTNSSGTPISDSEFQSIFKSIKQEAFEKKRLEMAQKSLQNAKCISVNQVGQMMDLFNFSSFRMKFLEMAYKHTSNKNDFGILESKLTFDKDKEKLKEIIRNGER